MNVQSKSIVVETLSEPPIRPFDNEVKNKIKPQENNEASTSNQFVIEIDSSLFSNESGIVKKYLIYVRQNQNNNMSEITLNGTYMEAWNNVSIDYLALEIPINSSTKSLMKNDGNISVLVGNETICLNKSIKTTPCNGPLKPSTIYKLIVGGCTIAGCTHVLSEQFKTRIVLPPPNKPGSSKGWVAVFPILAIAIVAILATWKRKTLGKMINRKIRKIEKNSEDLGISSISLSSIYVTPLMSEKQYIACQGPLENTCEDFWDMIIQYGVKKIVMLTRTEERNPHNPSQTLSKCYRYFPDKKGQFVRFNRVVVEVLDVDNQTNVDLEIRHLLIKADNIEYRVFHYFFTGWPDFSAVEPQKLLDLIQNINSHGKNQLSSVERSKEALFIPIVVHCSAGVGRTGTYIAVDIIMRLIDREQKNLLTMKLDVMGIVYQLRQDRGKMVQTKDQYMLVNRCVEEYLKQTNRLNDILQQSSLYENVSMDSTKYNNNASTKSSLNYANKNEYSPSEAGNHVYLTNSVSPSTH
ncbi:unnamed protein product [Rotaria sp. Silwood2]|nr:unnamed protein product [Rotaria sp. Silwood2]CAF4322646.1 unnamed protein product [Rotaria sp. Silwood2]